jgi:uncharacterized protein (TIGR03084 family)
VALNDVFTDLTMEGNDLDAVVAGLDDAQWSAPTPAEGWTVAHQIAHLAATFKLATLAAGAPDVFDKVKAGLSADFEANVNAAMAPYLSAPPAGLLQRFREERAAADKALGALTRDTLVRWLVRPLPASVLAAAGMMELFGHGQDVYDALGVRRTYDDRIGHLCFFGARTWDFGYLARNQPVPDVALRFELTAPSGTVWTFGPDDSTQVVRGPAADFCLLVVRRRHRDDLALVADGTVADDWLNIAQAYRGPAGPGRRPGQFPR